MNEKLLNTPVRHLVFIGVVTSVMLFFYGQINYERDPYARWDLYHYRQIAEAAPNVAANVQQPYAFRLLGPYVAGVLPLPEQASFLVLTLLASFALPIIFYFFLVSQHITQAAAAVAAALLVFNKHFFGFNVWNFFQLNDVLSLIYIVILMWATSARRWKIYAATLLLAAATRETAFLVVPATLIFLWERREWATHGKSFLLAVLPGMLLFAALHQFVPHAGGLGWADALARYAPKLAWPSTWFRLFFNAFVPLSLVPFLFFKNTLGFFKQHRFLAVYMALVVFSTLFGADNERLMAPGFVAFYWLIAALMQERLGNRRWPLVLFLAAGFLASFHTEIGRFLLANSTQSFVLFLATTLIVAATAFLATRFSTRVANEKAAS